MPAFMSTIQRNILYFIGKAENTPIASNAPSYNSVVSICTSLVSTRLLSKIAISTIALPIGLITLAGYLIQGKRNYMDEAMNGDLPSLLKKAIKSGKIADIHLRLQQGADINISFNDGQTPLITASSHWNEEKALATVTYLLENGAQATINTPDQEGNSPIDCAIGQGFISVAKYLREHGATFTLPKLVTLAIIHGLISGENCAIAIITYLLELTIEINDINTNKNNSAIDFALEINQLQVATFLFSKGAIFNRSKAMETAIASGSLETVQYLHKEHGIAINSMSLLIIATKADQVHIVKYLLKHGADRTAEDETGKIAYTIAEESNNQVLMSLLSIQ